MSLSTGGNAAGPRLGWTEVRQREEQENEEQSPWLPVCGEWGQREPVKLNGSELYAAGSVSGTGSHGFFCLPGVGLNGFCLPDFSITSSPWSQTGC